MKLLSLYILDEVTSDTNLIFHFVLFLCFSTIGSWYQSYQTDSLVNIINYSDSLPVLKFRNQILQSILFYFLNPKIVSKQVPVTLILCKIFMVFFARPIFPHIQMIKIRM